MEGAGRVATVHAGVPLQIPDGVLLTHDVRVRVRQLPPGWEPDPVIVATPAAAVDFLLGFLEVDSGDDWEGLQPGDAVVGVLGELLNLPDLPTPVMNELVPTVLERASLVLDVIEALPVYVEVPSRMRWIRTQVVANLGPLEQMVHTINWMDDGPPTAGIGRTNATVADDAALQAFVNTVRTEWDAFLAQPFGVGGGSEAISNYLAPGTRYDSVRGALCEQTSANVSGGDNKGKFHQITEETKVAAIAPHTTQGTPLPYQIAMALTLRTAAAQAGGSDHGRSNRGRTFLGGFSTRILGSDGLFLPLVKAGIGDAYGDFLDRVHAATDKHAVVLSLTRLRGVPITMVQAGAVPDTQRRRRKSLLEARVNAWSGQLNTVQVGS